MVFSLFKKTQEKMPERPAARPKPAAVPVPETNPPSRPAAPIPIPPAPEEDLPVLDFTDSQFDDTAFAESSIEIESDGDPVQVDIEQAAVLFANGQESAARAVLEAAVRAHAGPEARRLWHMLLDLMQVQGDRPAFEKLGMEYAQACETSPPGWRQPEAAPVRSAVTVVLLQGVISGADAPELDPLQAALARKEPVQVDLGKLASCDEAAAGSLCHLLRRARQEGVNLALAGSEGLVGRLEKRLVAGQRTSAGAWLLLLELYQRTGRPAEFEDKAVEYAVTFEVSPPSWESARAAAGAARAAAPPPAENVLVLAGELKNYRFDELPKYIESAEQPILDFSQVRRLDFFSAGLLRNTLEPYRRQGKEVIIRHPHHLVVELMGIVGLNHVARIIVPKS